MDPVFRWVVGLVFLLGSPFAAIGAWEAVETARALERHHRTQGIVLENRLVVDRRDGQEERAYLPVVEYRNAEGTVARFTDGVGSLPADYAVGEAVPVAIDPQDPRRGRICSWKRLWFAPTLLVGVGLLPGAVCAFVLRHASRRGGS